MYTIQGVNIQSYNINLNVTLYMNLAPTEAILIPVKIWFDAVIISGMALL